MSIFWSRVRANFLSSRYTQACTRLIAQYKTIMNALGSEFVVHKFIEEYEVANVIPLCFSFPRFGVPPQSTG